MEHVKNAMDRVKDKDYVEFEKAVHKEMQCRLHNDPYVKRRREEIQRYNDISNMFTTINKLSIGE